MTKEDKDLLLIDLCARLPYGVKVQTTYINQKSKERRDIGTDVLTTVELSMLIDGFEEHKPYLFPLSSMTEEQKEEYQDLLDNQYSFDTNGNIFTLQDFYCKYHLDYRGLIKKRLAIDCTNLSIY